MTERVKNARAQALFALFFVPSALSKVAVPGALILLVLVLVLVLALGPALVLALGPALVWL